MQTVKVRNPFRQPSRRAERVPVPIVKIIEHFLEFANTEHETLHFNDARVFEFVIQRL